MRNRSVLFVIALALFGVASGCSTPEPPPSPTPSAPAATGKVAVPGSTGKMAGSIDLSTDPAPAGVKTDLSGGMK